MMRQSSALDQLLNTGMENSVPLHTVISHNFHFDQPSGCVSWRHGLQRVVVPAVQDEHGAIHVAESVAATIKEIVGP